MHTKPKFRVLYAIGLIALTSAGACGGGQSESPPPETAPPPSEPAPEPSTTAGDEAAGDEGQHTMPDGTTMPGHHHGEGTEAPEAE